jgi:hypothetical protein
MQLEYKTHRLFVYSSSSETLDIYQNGRFVKSKFSIYL